MIVWGRKMIGWLPIGEFLKRTGKRIGEDRCSGFAAEIAYYFLFAIFPFLLFLVTLLGFLPFPGLDGRIMHALEGVIPEQAAALVKTNVTRIVGNRHGGLLSFGILLSLWTASTAIVALSEGLNAALRIGESRSYARLRATAILIVVCFSFFITVSLALLMFGHSIGSLIADRLGLGALFSTLWQWIRWSLSIVLALLAFAGIYRLAPDGGKGRRLFPGALFAVVAWFAASGGFSFYVSNFGSYDKTYGSVGAIIVLLTWLYLSGLIIMVGGEINAVGDEAERQRGKG